jgi:hypothetical protein
LDDGFLFAEWMGAVSFWEGELEVSGEENKVGGEGIFVVIVEGEDVLEEV